MLPHFYCIGAISFVVDDLAVWSRGRWIWHHQAEGGIDSDWDECASCITI